MLNIYIYMNYYKLFIKNKKKMKLKRWTSQHYLKNKVNM